jgi:hypothetical protein
MPDLLLSRSAHNAESADPSKHSSHTLGLALSVARRYVHRSVRGTRLQIGSYALADGGESLNSS